MAIFRELQSALADLNREAERAIELEKELGNEVARSSNSARPGGGGIGAARDAFSGARAAMGPGAGSVPMTFAQGPLAGPAWNSERAAKSSFDKYFDQKIDKLRSQAAASGRGRDFEMSARGMVNNTRGVVELLSGQLNLGNLKDTTEIVGAAAHQLGLNKVAGRAGQMLGVASSIFAGAGAAYTIREVGRGIAEDAARPAYRDTLQREAAVKAFDKTPEMLGRVDRLQTRYDANVFGFAKSFTTSKEKQDEAEFNRKLAETFQLDQFQRSELSFDEVISQREQRITKYFNSVNDLTSNTRGLLGFNMVFGTNFRNQAQASAYIRQQIEQGADGRDLELRVFKANQLLRTDKDTIENYQRMMDPIRDAQYRSRETLAHVYEKERSMALQDWNKI